MSDPVSLQISGTERYARQTLLPEVGVEGQERLLASSATLVGCGALGSVIASLLVRAGVGRLRIVDRDYIELNNLQRQILFDEEDIARGLPKAIAASEKLARVNSEIEIEPVVADVNPGNVEGLISDVDLVLDGTDNFETRLLLNDACLKHRVPWVYGGVLATYGMMMAFVPDVTACFRCFVPDLPAPGATPTCDTVGVLGAAASVVASLEVVEGLKILMGRAQELHGHLLYVDVWRGSIEPLTVRKSSVPCPACDLAQYDYLAAQEGSYLTRLCGRDAVQITVRGDKQLRLADLGERLQQVGEVRYNDHMLLFASEPYHLTIFPDGRAIVKGTTDDAMARSLYARYVGL